VNEWSISFLPKQAAVAHPGTGRQLAPTPQGVGH
jgi:hypothetical protein